MTEATLTRTRRAAWLVLLAALTALLLGSATRVAPAHAQTGQAATVPDVSVAIDRTRVTVGDPIALTVTVRYGPGIAIRTTSIDEQLGDLEPLSSEPPDVRQVSGGSELRLRYKVAAYKTGTVQVPVFTFDYTTPDGTQQSVKSKAPLDVTVQSVLPPGAEPTDIRPLKPQISLPGPRADLLLRVLAVAGGLLVVLVAGLGAYLLFRRRSMPPQPAPAYAEVARAELDRIMALNLLEQGEITEHYRLIAACIRQYLTARYGFPAVALTTGELERQMEAHGISRWPARLVVGLLNEADAAVYARYRPARTRSEADNAIAYEIIDRAEEPEPVVARAG